jgi:hypothetical protein
MVILESCGVSLGDRAAVSTARRRHTVTGRMENSGTLLRKPKGTHCNGVFRAALVSDAAPLVLTLSLLMSYIYGAPCKARNFNVVYIWTYVWQR